MKTLFILNDPPYGSERSYNALRLAGQLVKQEAGEVRVFLMGDAATCGKAGQTTPSGYYNLERMLAVVARGGGTLMACGSCLDARGLREPELAEGVRRGSLDELGGWVRWADRVLVF